MVLSLKIWLRSSSLRSEFMPKFVSDVLYAIRCVQISDALDVFPTILNRVQRFSYVRDVQKIFDTSRQSSVLGSGDNSLVVMPN